MAGVDRLSDLPEPILIHILSMLPHAKQVVQTCILSKQWRFLWKSVPVSLDFEFSDSDNVKDTLDFMASTNRELNYWRYCDKIRKFRVCLFNYRNHYVKDVDLWIHFATKLANVESFAIEFQCVDDTYEFPQFAFRNASLRNLVLRHLELNPSGSVNWSSLVSLSIGHLNLTESVIEKVLSGCPNLERLKLHHFWGIYRLEISSTKLRKLIIKDYYNLYDDLWLEILAPFIQTLELLGQCSDVRVSRKTVPSLVTAVLHLDRLNFYFDEEDDDEVDPTLEKQYSNMKELLHSVAHVENLQLSSWCIECLSILELKGWQPPPSSRKFLKLNAALEQLDFPGICSFLQSSSSLKTLVIDWNDHKPRLTLSCSTCGQLTQMRTNITGDSRHIILTALCYI
ncbi:F-box/LRR-repeat protein 25-like isoform X2 [Lycium barbarum]|uniref:F-box/LRR-repeat protein 25-like isoform X2 n=1 Tax=Lycium barbarum TaxID=112863 RepID=UPI00293E5C3E|nr:F-box/LRR-repeat protein 25-like isoform X2 [Lycium barbarum]